jgi:hypothetical protein
MGDFAAINRGIGFDTLPVLVFFCCRELNKEFNNVVFKLACTGKYNGGWLASTHLDLSCPENCRFGTSQRAMAIHGL